MTSEELEHINTVQAQLIEKQNAKITSLQEQFNQLLKLVNGFKSERFIPSQIPSEQLNMFEDSSEQQDVQEEASQTITYQRKAKKHQRRNKLPEHLPVKEVIIEPEEDTQEMTKIGEEVSETLEYTPASLVKNLLYALSMQQRKKIKW